MKNLDDYIASVVEKATQKAMAKSAKDLEKKMDSILKQLTLLNVQRDTEDRLLSLTEASKLLGVNLNKLRELTDSGEINRITPPGCRGKILLSSIHAYIGRISGNSA